MKTETYTVTCKGCGKPKEVKRVDYMAARNRGQTEFWHKECQQEMMKGKWYKK